MNNIIYKRGVCIYPMSPQQIANHISCNQNELLYKNKPLYLFIHIFLIIVLKISISVFYII